MNNDTPLLGTYEVTLRIPLTAQQRLDYGSPEFWWWHKILDKCLTGGYDQEITVKNCELIMEVSR